MTLVSKLVPTERLILRPVLPDDLDAYVTIYADPEVVRFIGGGGASTTREGVADWIERTIRRNELDGWDMRSILRVEDGALLGWCGIAVHGIEGGIEREVGYVLAREHWGCGYATEAATAMRDHALGSMRLRRLVALIDHGNNASKRVAGKLGMAYEREVMFHDRLVEMHALEV